MMIFFASMGMVGVFALAFFTVISNGASSIPVIAHPGRSSPTNPSSVNGSMTGASDPLSQCRRDRSRNTTGLDPSLSCTSSGISGPPQLVLRPGIDRRP